MDQGKSAQPLPRPPDPGIGDLAASGRRFMRSPGMKFFALGFLALLLLIPLAMVQGLVREREGRFREATAAIGAQWGGAQTIAGPWLAAPAIVEKPARTAGELPRRAERHILLAPDRLNIEGDVATDTLKRGIHEAVVWRGTLTGRAAFSRPDLATLGEDVLSVDWSKARLVMLVTSLKGVETIEIKAGAGPVGPVEPGLGLPLTANAPSGLNAAINMANAFMSSAPGPVNQSDAPVAPPLGQRDISFAIALKGSQTLYFAPVGDMTNVALTSAWPHPSFAGAFLPANRDVRTDGFKASWAVPKLARPLQHVALASAENFNQALGESFGVRLITPVDFYTTVERAVKYGVIFIGLAFVIVFAIELLAGGGMHVAQYAMTGMMIVVFYTLLLALAEIAGFGLAYAIAAGATGAVLAGFVASLFPGRRWAVTAFGGFALLYGMLYVILNMEDAALLAGAITGFLLLTALMFATRKVDWSGRVMPAEAVGSTG